MPVPKFVIALIEDLSVVAEKLAPNSVITTKIKDAAVTAPKLADGVVTADKVADGSVTTTKIGDGAVTSVKLADLAVTTAKLADGSVTEPKLGTGAVTNTKIGALAVTSDKLASNSVLTSKILNGNVTFDKLSAAVQAMFGAGGGAGIPDTRLVIDDTQASDSASRRFATIAAALAYAADELGGVPISIELTQSTATGHAWDGSIPSPSGGGSNEGEIGGISFMRAGGAAWNGQEYQQAPDLNLTSADIQTRATETFISFNGLWVRGDWQASIQGAAHLLYLVFHRCYWEDSPTMNAGTTFGGQITFYAYECTTQYEFGTTDNDWQFAVTNGTNGGQIELFFKGCTLSGALQSGLFNSPSGNAFVVLDIRQSTLKWNQNGSFEMQMFDLEMDGQVWMDNVSIQIRRGNGRVALFYKNDGNMAIERLRDVRVYFQRFNGTPKSFGFVRAGQDFTYFVNAFADKHSVKLYAQYEGDDPRLPVVELPLDAPDGTWANFDNTGHFHSMVMHRWSAIAQYWSESNNRRKLEGATTNGAGQTFVCLGANNGDDVQRLGIATVDRKFLVRLRAIANGSLALGDTSDVVRDAILSVTSAGTVTVEHESTSAGPSGAADLTGAAVTIAPASGGTNPGFSVTVDQGGTYAGNANWHVDVEIDRFLQ